MLNIEKLLLGLQHTKKISKRPNNFNPEAGNGQHVTSLSCSRTKLIHSEHEHDNTLANGNHVEDHVHFYDSTAGSSRLPGRQLGAISDPSLGGLTSAVNVIAGSPLDRDRRNGKNTTVSQLVHPLMKI